ncbi:MAG TPA: response regulator [Deltaproteobacteria bacterium]|nr:response regulator [Deltaproteobacteria bacterium]
MQDPKSVLIVDDSRDLVRLVADFLAMYGYRVYTAHDGEDALCCLERTDVGIVVTDIHMPRMDGFTLMDEIKSRHPQVPVVLVTGYSVHEARKIAFERGADAFMAKPFKLRDLKSVIDEVSKDKVRDTPDGGRR